MKVSSPQTFRRVDQRGWRGEVVSAEGDPADPAVANGAQREFRYGATALTIGIAVFVVEFPSAHQAVAGSRPLEPDVPSADYRDLGVRRKQGVEARVYAAPETRPPWLVVGWIGVEGRFVVHANSAWRGGSVQEVPATNRVLAGKLFAAVVSALRK